MKIVAITFKELLITFRDRTALVLMLVAPVALALVMSFAFSGMGGGGLPQVPMALVNLDDGEIGQALVDAFQADELRQLVAVTVLPDATVARQGVDDEKYVAAVIIPEGMTGRIFVRLGDPKEIEVYSNPATPISAGIVRTITGRMVDLVSAGAAAARTAVSQLFESGRADVSQEMELLSRVGGQAAEEAMTREIITIQTQVGRRVQAEQSFDFLAYYTPGMAVLFLMFAMMTGGRSLLVEREAGTLARLQTTPLAAGELLTGKVLGVFATGLLQMTVLVLFTRYTLGVAWGKPAAVTLLVVLTVSAIAALGLLIATVARTTSQAVFIGSSVVMVLAAAGGNFVPRLSFPQWLRTISLVGPNAWAMEGFQKLHNGAALGDISTELVALALITAVFFGLALMGFRKFVK
jgi:ABC-2 type transport system permease protein